MSIPDRRARLLALALAVTAVATVVEAQPALDLEDCRIDGVSVPVRCGSLTVFEDRAAEAGRTIDLKIVVIPAVSGSPEPDPLFLLAGGPGQAATDLAERVLVRLAEVRQSRDIVFVDQRGTGGSGRMSCALFESGSDEGTSGESLQLDTLPLDDLRDCLAEIESAADPRHYTTPVAMDDLDDVRAALGYETTQPVRRFLRHPRRPYLHAPASGTGPRRGARRLGSRLHAPAVEHGRRCPARPRPAVRRLRGRARLPRGLPGPAGDVRARH